MSMLVLQSLVFFLMFAILYPLPRPFFPLLRESDAVHKTDTTLLLIFAHG